MTDNNTASTNTSTHATINSAQSDLPGIYNPDPVVSKKREAAWQANSGKVAPPNPKSVKWARSSGKGK